MTKALTRETLAQFIGTQHYFRHGFGLVLTDGVAFLARNGTGWLLDIITSARLVPGVHAEPFEAWRLTVDRQTSTALVICTDGGKDGRAERELYRQEIEFTDFPLDDIALYVIHDEALRAKVVLLSSEY